MVNEEYNTELISKALDEVRVDERRLIVEEIRDFATGYKEAFKLTEFSILCRLADELEAELNDPPKS